MNVCLSELSKIRTYFWPKSKFFPAAEQIILKCVYTGCFMLDVSHKSKQKTNLTILGHPVL